MKAKKKIEQASEFQVPQCESMMPIFNVSVLVMTRMLSYGFIFFNQLNGWKGHKCDQHVFFIHNEDPWCDENIKESKLSLLLTGGFRSKSSTSNQMFLFNQSVKHENVFHCQIVSNVIGRLVFFFFRCVVRMCRLKMKTLKIQDICLLEKMSTVFFFSESHSFMRSMLDLGMKKGFIWGSLQKWWSINRSNECYRDNFAASLIKAQAICRTFQANMNHSISIRFPSM